MPYYPIEIDQHALTITVRDRELIEVAESIAHSVGVGYTAKVDDKLVIRCTHIEGLALLGDLLAFRRTSPPPTNSNAVAGR
jgi:hypothetical protein